MRKIIVNEHLSLDGVIQGPGGPDEDTTGGFELGGWTAKYSDDVSDQSIMEVLNRPYDLLLGRFTYDIWKAYWPFQTGPIPEKFNAINKYVATQSLEEGSWQNTVLLNGDTIQQVKVLKASDGPDLQMWGSADFIQSLLRHSLIDEINLWVYPVVLGKGKRLFAGGTIPGAFKLSKHAVSGTNVFIATYIPNGEVQIGQAGAD
jgi:dihydrofolate reductase